MRDPTLASDTAGTIVVSWEIPSPAPSDYRVDWAKSSEAYTSWRVDAGHLYPAGTATTVTIEGLEAGVEYKVRMRARYNAGDYAEDPWSGPFTGDVLITVAALTATLNVPDDHDGSSFTVGLDLSEPIVDSYRHVRDHTFTVTGGSITEARRVNPQTQSGRRVASQWELTVQPTQASNDVILSATGGRSCNQSGALCTLAGQSLSHALNATISRQQGTPSLSVSDAEATEGDDATLDFVVTLAPAATGTVTVDYATSDGTATAGADYTATTGTLTFAAGETTKTVAVPIIDDVIADNGETLNLTLSNASGASLGDSAAVGTIRNTEVPGPVIDLSVQPGTNGTDYIVKWQWPAVRHGRAITAYEIWSKGCGTGRHLMKVVPGIGVTFTEFVTGRDHGGSTFGIRALNSEGAGPCVSKKATPWVSWTTNLAAADFMVGSSTVNGYAQSNGGTSRLGKTTFQVDSRGTTYTVTKLYRSGSTVVFATSPALPQETAAHLALTTQNSTGHIDFVATLCFSDATKSGGDYTWTGTTLSSLGSHVSVLSTVRLNGLVPGSCD